MVLWLLAGIGGFVFGIFLASSLKLDEPLYVFSLATFFAIICVTIAYHFTRLFINRLSGRMIYLAAGFIVLAALASSAFLLMGAY
ncbi:MAG: hypothetical protein ACRERV_09100 [Methylococcales bacterium]